jgi:hypothetical protein
MAHHFFLLFPTALSRSPIGNNGSSPVKPETAAIETA